MQYLLIWCFPTFLIPLTPNNMLTRWATSPVQEITQLMINGTTVKSADAYYYKATVAPK